jgi:hypothetical protein
MLLDKMKAYCRQPYEALALDRMKNAEKYPGLVAWDSHTIHVRLLSLPSFHPYTTWLVRRHDEYCEVRRVIWDRLVDIRELLPGDRDEPTMFGADAVIPKDEAKPLLDELSQMTVPPFMSVPVMGIDGTTYSISSGDYWTSATLTWWCDPPPPWRDVAAWFHRATEIFDRYLPARTADIPPEQRRRIQPA